MKNDDWSDYDSGPYCQHWNELSYCKNICEMCNHYCNDHNNEDKCYGNLFCKCKIFVDKK